MQRQGLDFNSTYASMAKSATWRLIFALAASYNWKAEQLDIKTAFLNGKINGEVYFKQSTGFRHGNDLVC